MGKRTTKNAPLKRRVEIEDILKTHLEGVDDKKINEIAESLKKEFVRRIQIKEIDERRAFVFFTCNLSPDEMEERIEEVRTHLPKNGLADDCMYTISLKKNAYHPKPFNEYPKPSQKRTGWWEYFAEI